MMLRATPDDQASIIKELKHNITENIYLYLDILNYGVTNQSIQTWINKTPTCIDTIVLKYHDSFQLYSADTCDIEGIVDLIRQYTPAMISGSARLIRLISQSAAKFYHPSYGYVLSQPYTGTSYDPEPLFATEEDIEEIAHLVCSDAEVGGHYDEHDLREQFRSRLSDKTGRHCYIRMDGRIVAHYATYAEASNIAVTGGLIVSPQYTGRGFARILHCYLADKLIMEHRLPVLFCNENVLELYLKLGGVVISKYGALKKLK